MLILVLLPIAAFALIWFWVSSWSDSDKFSELTWQEALIFASLFWFVYLALGTELLSLFKGLTTLSVALMWGVLVAILAVAAWRKQFIGAGWRKLRQLIVWPRRPYALFGLGIIVIILAILLITGILSPPNIHDVLVYHMTRVAHWIQNRSVGHYATPITHQLFNPPFAEYNMLHWTILLGSDDLSAFHQWYGLLLTLVAVSATAKELGLDKKGQWFSALFVATLPVIVLQTAGAKNDVFLGYMIAVLMYFVVKAAKRKLSFLDWVGTAIVVGLGLLTKGHYAFYALPLLAWLLISILKRGGVKTAVKFVLLGLLVITLLNAAFWARNIQVFDGPFGNESSELFMNGRFGVDVTVSNLSRHIVMQLLTGGFVNNLLVSGVQGLHRWMGVDLFDQRSTLGPSEFSFVPTREEVAPNPVHFALTVFVLLVLLISFLRKKDRKGDGAALLLGLLGVSGLVIFSSVFRWQVWGSRFLIPYYIIFAPAVGYAISKRLGSGTVWAVSLVLILWAINPLINNYSKSFSWAETNRNSIWRMSRKGLLFANEQAIEGDILELTHAMDLSGCRDYGFVAYTNVPEYLIWATLTPDPSEYTLGGYAVQNPSAKLSSPTYAPCGIIVYGDPPPEEILDRPYTLAERWDQIPLSLYLLPEFN